MREETEQTLRSFRKDVDEAAAVRLDLERRLESLMDEISFLKKVHDEEIQEMTSMMEAQQVSVELELAKPDLTSALKEIRSQYESVASKNLQSAEEWYKSKFSSLSEQVTRSSEAARAGREEINEYRRQLQGKTIEIETLKGANESLERQIAEVEDAHTAEVTAMQVGQEKKLIGRASRSSKTLLICFFMSVTHGRLMTRIRFIVQVFMNIYGYFLL